MQLLLAIFSKIPSAVWWLAGAASVAAVVLLTGVLTYRKKPGILKDLSSAGFVWFLGVTLAIGVVYFMLLMSVTGATGDASNGRFSSSGQFGDSFGALTAIVNALALAALVATVVQQSHQLQDNRDLEQRKEGFQRLQIHQERAAAVNFTIFTLARMYSEQLDYRRQVLDKVRNHPLRWYALRPSHLHVLAVPRFEYQKLQFLFSSNNADTMSIVALEETRFANLLDLVKRRNELHMQEVQLRMQAAGYQHGSQVEVDELERLLGPVITNSLKNYTDMIFEFTDAGLQSTHAAATALRESAMSMVGDETIIRFEPRALRGESGANPRPNELPHL
jgi:hypothetical protein